MRFNAQSYTRAMSHAARIGARSPHTTMAGGHH